MKIKEADLRVTELCFLCLYGMAGKENSSRIFGHAEEICQMARNLDCEIVVAVPAMSQECVGFTVEQFRQMCRVAAGYGVRIGLEFPATAYKVNHLAAAWKLIEGTKSENAGLVIDTFHFFLGNSKNENLVKIPAEKIFLVHISDAMDVSLQKLRTHHDYRTFPGEGIIDYTALFRYLNKNNYSGAFSLEIWNQNFLKVDAQEIALKGSSSLNNLIRSEAGC